MTSVKDQQKAITSKGKGLFKSWLNAITIRKGDSAGVVVLKLLKAVGGVIFVILASPVILLIVIFALAIAL